MFGNKKKFKTLEEYKRNGLNIKLEINDENEKRFSLRSDTPNRQIKISQKNGYVTHEIYDTNKGQQKFEIPIDIYLKLFK
ncbi:hypothetical protein [Bacillus xiapuensis]|uniref:hypothetical protein n=1 Tax=Bacillus xiapuensis TaxID=2014075 RepID=UPI000C245A69|nr:hypothetical protein [Bacillus xiapuensis]